MSDLSLGIIEIIGLAGAIEAADVCLKSANVKLVGYELTRGNGMTVIKIEGNVADVKAAIDASRTSVGKISKVVSTKVIPRPSNEIQFLIRNKDTVGLEKPEDNLENNDFHEQPSENFEKHPNQKNEKIHYKLNEKNGNEDLTNKQKYSDETNDSENKSNTEYESKTGDIKTKNNNIKVNGDTVIKYTCNLCKDPACPRHKGELRNACIHYKQKK